MKAKLMLPVLLACLVSLGGCATVSRPLVPVTAEGCWTDPEQSSERIRFFSNVEAKQALQAAEQIFRLAGKNEMKIESSPQSVSAEYYRRSMIYLFLVAHSVEVWDRWMVSTRVAENGVQVCVHVTGQYFSDAFVLGAEPRTNAVYPASAIEPNPGRRLKPRSRAYPVNYDTFWARMAYLLGFGDAWPECRWGGGIERHEARGRQEMDPLCHVLDDGPPAGARGS